MISEKESPNCLICDSKNAEILYNDVPDRFSLNQTFTIVRCQQCGFTYLSPRPVENAMPQYYDLEEYQPHNLSNKSLSDRMYRLIRDKNSKNKRKLIERLTKGRKLLDIGCGTGEFLQEMHEYGWHVQGMESAPEPRKVAASQSFPVEANLQEVKGTFDIITLWHVLEHIHRVNDLFREMKKLLAPDGFVVFAVPNIESLDAQYYKKYWVALDTPRHLYHFRPVDLDKLFNKNELEILQIKPILYFDPWYNALLSSKLKAEIANKSFLRYAMESIIIAKLSFFKGLLNNKKCASPVYIARRKQL